MRHSLLALLLFCSTVAVGQDNSSLMLNQPQLPEKNAVAEAAKPVAEATPIEAVKPEDPPTIPEMPSGISKAALEARIQQVASSADLDSDLKTQLTDLLTKAVAGLEVAKQASDRNEQLMRQATTAPQEIAKLEQELQQLSSRPADEITQADDLPLEQVRNQHRQAVADLAVLDQSLASLNEQAERWNKRMADLPTLVATSTSALAENEKQLNEIENAGSDDPLIAARRSLLLARNQQLQQERKLLDTESRISEDAQRLLSLKRDFTGRKQLLMRKQVESLQLLLAEAEKKQAQQQAVQARLAAEFTYPAIKNEARLNTKLAEQRMLLLEALEKDRTSIADAQQEYATKDAQFTETRKHAEAAGFSEQIGLLLRNEKNELPNTGTYRQRSQQRSDQITALTVEILKLENSRRKLLDLDAAVSTRLNSPTVTISEGSRERVEEELRELLNDRLTLYRDLTENTRKRLSQLVTLNAAELRLADLIDQHAAFVSEHVLWVPSTAPMSVSLFVSAISSIGEFFHLDRLRRSASILLGDVRQNPIASVPVWFLFAWLLLSRRRIKQELSRLGEDAARPNATLLSPTLNAVIITVLISAPTALVFIWLGWRFSRGAPIGTTTFFFGQALFSGGVMLYCIDFVRQVFRPDGLAQAHFDWEVTATHAFRRGLIWGARIVVPCSIIVLYAELLGNELTIASLGRLAFAVAMIVSSIILWQWLGPNNVAVRNVGATSKSWFVQASCSFAPVLTVVPLALLIGSLVGYHYAAVQLSWRFFVSIIIVAIVIFSRALLLRWLLITYRRVAIHRAKERRTAMAIARESTAEMPSDAVEMIEGAGHVQLSDLNRQAQSFLRFVPVVLGVIGLYITWSDFIPALGVIHRYPLPFWRSTLRSIDSDLASPWITVGDLFLAVVSVVLTLIASRNVPGLLDMTLLQRLPLDAGARYAASALARYVIFIVGSLAVFRFLGVGWSNVQWLVAAMTVGLGFGLQEIFANFVSGIILLFERPARVGDTVTIGNVTGTVTRIRTRATTILDWDNKELIVPNKEFVTGNLVNWTLCNSSLRVVIPVGVAYGSDTRLTTKLLYGVAQQNPLTLDDPEPIVVFSAFGDSALDFELRVFTNGVVNSRRLKHELHLAIDDAFREHGIEIAFPQHDLHVRSIDGVDLKNLPIPLKSKPD